jgi:hypothetical protein
VTKTSLHSTPSSICIDWIDVPHRDGLLQKCLKILNAAKNGDEVAVKTELDAGVDAECRDLVWTLKVLRFSLLIHQLVAW